MIVLLIKASLIIVILLGFYKLVLERESFFRTNRLYLLACLALACALPFISLPQLVENQGWVSTIIEDQDLSQSSSPAQTQEEVSSLVPSASPIEPSIPKELESSIDSESLETQQAIEPLVVKETSNVKGLFWWISLIYFFGVAVLTINLLAQIIGTLRRITKNPDKIEDSGSIIVNLSGEVEPCSFFSYIFINPAQYEYEAYEQIIAHEKIHVKQKHSLDLLMAELAVIVLWFNPFVWLLRKEVEKNLEYQTDEILVRNAAETKESYQMNLVKIASLTKPLNITTNYNQSLIKQRILKMNSKKSNQYSYWKYAFIAPLVFGMLIFINKPSMSLAPNDLPIVTPMELVDHLMPVTTNREGSITEIVQEPEATEANPVHEVGTVSGDDCKELIQAVRDQNVAKVKSLLRSIDPNCIDQESGYDSYSAENGMTHRKSKARTPLTAAARLGNLEIAKILMKAGADMDLEDKNFGSPMAEAACGGYIDFVAYMLDQGADINEMSQGQGTALNCASRNGHLKLINFLLSKGSEINLQNDGQGSALNAAARNGHNQIVKLLIARGADIDAHTNGQGSALNAAARNGQTETIALLIKLGADLNKQNNGQGSALSAAARNGQTQLIKMLVDNGANINAQTNGQGSALNAAARNEQYETVKLLLDLGADPNIQNDGQGSALNAAAREGHIKMIKLLVAQGADLNIQTNGQGSALNAAARNNQYEAVKLLLSLGADVNVQNDGQGAALNAAARNGHMEIVKLLVENGADVDQRSNGQGTAIDSAKRNGHSKIVKYLASKSNTSREE
ncbi:MAG: ankyrin repeat domain-containing protein [Bacteroidia bacterium]